MADSQRKTANLLDVNTSISGAIKGSPYSAQDYGTIISSQYTKTSEYIPITPTTQYTFRCNNQNPSAAASRGYAFYDNNKQVINIGDNTLYDILDTSTLTVTTPNTAAYMRISWDINATNIMLNLGSTALPYEPYGWLHSLRKLTTATNNITTLPADLYADGTNATVGLVGNMSQTATPTPINPIQPSETGERTANLFDEEYPNISGTIRYVPFYVGEGSFTLSTTTPYAAGVANVFLLSGNVSTGASTVGNGAWLNHKVTAQSDDGYVTIAYRHYTGTTSPVDFQTMLNSGSTALPYEPYGYKIPISSASTTTPVYLGEVETTRKIKKLVFDGTEDWRSQYNGFTLSITKKSGWHTIICTHYPETNSTSVDKTIYNNSTNVIIILDSDYENVTDFKAYLAAQYAAGTPVTVWYVLATPETGIVNEPLRKIGDYADTVSGITIPTITGKDTFDVLTTLKPSEVSLAYTGWHDATVKEWDGSEWQ